MEYVNMIHPFHRYENKCHRDKSIDFEVCWNRLVTLQFKIFKKNIIS